MNVREIINGIVRDLREKRLWPVALVLLVALVAVPVLLSKSSSSPAPVGQASAPGGAAPNSTALPAVSVRTAPGNSHLRGNGRDPFIQQGGGFAASTSTTSTSSSSTSTSAPTSGSSSTTSGGTSTTSTSSGGTSTGSTSTGGSTSSGSGSGSSSSPTPISTGKPKPAPSGLTAKQSYGVTFTMTNSSGGLDTISSLKRLSVLPSEHQPLLVELGVLKGGNRVLFAVERGTVLSGPGTCTPGPIDCEILSLGQNQTESLSTWGPNGISHVALFAITGIRADHYPSAAAANKARRTESAAGRALLAKSNLPSLSLFQYEPSIGSVVDLRNLTVRNSNGS